MRRSLSLLPLAFAALLPARLAAQAPADAPLQAVVVLTEDWNATTATLARFERSSATAPWREVGERIPAVVGRTGLAWGRGLHGDSIAAGPRKREGDGKAPAGIFRLGTAFGYAPAGSLRGVRLPYVATDASVECVDDSNSRHYNRLVDRDTVARPDWTSHEEMRRPDELYRLGVWVDHNVSPRAPGGGSCIFLHIWRRTAERTSPTVGCTAMDAGDLSAVVRWLDPRARPVLVQAPHAHFDRLRARLALPAIPRT